MRTDHIQFLQIQTGVVLRTLKSGHQTLGGNVGSSQRQGAHSGIDNIDACLNAFRAMEARPEV